MTQHKFQSRRYETRVVIVFFSVAKGKLQARQVSSDVTIISKLKLVRFVLLSSSGVGQQAIVAIAASTGPHCGLPSSNVLLRRSQRTKVKIPTLLAPNVGKSQNQAGFPTQNDNLDGPLLASSGVACNPVFAQSYRPRLNLQSLEHIRWHFLLKVLFNLILLLVILERQQSGRMGGLTVWH